MNGKERRDRRSPIAVLHVGGLRFEDESAPVHVDEGLPLAPLHVLASIVAVRSSALGCFDALAVKYCGRRRCIPTDPLAVGHDQMVVDTRKQPIVTPAP